jgi:hypothetical protein
MKYEYNQISKMEAPGEWWDLFIKMVYIDMFSFLKLCGLSPRANYTDRAIAACRPS